MTRARDAADAPLPHPTRRNAHWQTIQFVLRLVFTVWLRYRARGVEKVPRHGGGLVLSNHQSFLDPLLIGLPLSRPVSFLARDSLFRAPVVGGILRNTYVMPINREAASTASIKEAVRRMQHGFLVGIFPEGTRSETGEVGPFKPGFIALIRRAQLPVYPVGIAGAHEALPRRAWFLHRRDVTVVFGDPLTPEEIERLSRRGQEEALVALARERVRACQREAEAWRTGTSAPPLGKGGRGEMAPGLVGQISNLPGQGANDGQIRNLPHEGGPRSNAAQASRATPPAPPYQGGEQEPAAFARNTP